MSESRRAGRQARTAERSKRGTGMGLAIVHRIVSDHNGAIRVADNLPRGTVFTIELPAR